MISIKEAAERIRAGEVVAFPTETVYGLGANALDAAAVTKIYELKGRPATSPLIVHVASIEMARALVTEWPAEADKLARQYWPGPLTLVLPKAPAIPGIVTAGLPTVGVRMPDHPLALGLIREAGVPVAAPSANRFTGLSATTAEHVRETFGEAVPVLDGGPCQVGIESTVVSIAAGKITLLRPGMISIEDVERASAPSTGTAHLAPGMHPRHYSPRTPLVLSNQPNPQGAYVWIYHSAHAAHSVQMPSTPEAYAARLYSVLYELDREGWPVISVESPPDTVEWAAVRDRLQGRNQVNLIEDIDQTLTATPTLWWLGRAGFVVRFANITFYVDPCLSQPGALLEGSAIDNADMILATHAHPGHLDAPSVIAILEKSKTAKLILPKSAADKAHAAGIPYPRMTTTDADLRVEYFKDNLYARIYAVPSAHPQLDRTPVGGYPYLGYLMRFGRWTVYHAGDCVPYDMLAERLRPYNVSVALLPVGGKNFSVSEAAQLAEDIGAKWLVPMHYESGQENDFVTHMLGQRPHQQFKVFQLGEKWTVPEE